MALRAALQRRGRGGQSRHGAARAAGAIPVWIEPAEPAHPLVGIVHALAPRGGRPVLVCAADLPFVTPATLARAGRAPMPAARRPSCRRGSGEAQPLLGRYERGRAAALDAPAWRGAATAMRTVDGPRRASSSRSTTEPSSSTSTRRRTCPARRRSVERRGEGWTGTGRPRSPLSVTWRRGSVGHGHAPRHKVAIRDAPCAEMPTGMHSRTKPMG